MTSRVEHIFILLFVSLIATTFATSVPGTAVYVSNAKSHCLDGTVPVYWIVKGSGSGANKWILFYEGGGLCNGLPGQGLPGGVDNCYNYTTSYYGGYYGSSSPSFIAPQYDFSSYYGNYLSQDSSLNPLIYNWNMVYMHYCDGGLWTGGVSSAVPVYGGSHQIYFQGSMISNDILQDLLTNQGMSAATEVIVSGSSAGGMAAFNKVDTVSKLFTTNNQGVTTNSPVVVGLVDSGFMLANNTGPCNFQDQIAWIYQNMNSSSALLNSCLSAYSSAKQQYLCMFPQYNLPFNPQNLFAIQSRYDSFQYSYILCEYQYAYADQMSQQTVANYGDELTAAFYQSGMGSASKSALYDNCPHHYNIYNTTSLQWFDPWNTIASGNGALTVKGPYTQEGAFSAWYTSIKEGNPMAFNLTQSPSSTTLNFDYCHNAVLITPDGRDDDNGGSCGDTCVIALLVPLVIIIFAYGVYVAVYSFDGDNGTKKKSNGHGKNHLDIEMT